MQRKIIAVAFTASLALAGCAQVAGAPGTSPAANAQAEARQLLANVCAAEPVAYAGLQAFAASGRISATWLRRAAVGHADVSAVCASLSGGASGIDFVTALRAATDAYQEILQAKKRAA
jgi:hypothetical protein